jgi:hypothetical protein
MLRISRCISSLLLRRKKYYIVYALGCILSCYHAWNLKKPKGKMAIFFTTTPSFKIKTRQRQ